MMLWSDIIIGCVAIVCLDGFRQWLAGWSGMLERE